VTLQWGIIVASNAHCPRQLTLAWLAAAPFSKHGQHARHHPPFGSHGHCVANNNAKVKPKQTIVHMTAKFTNFNTLCTYMSQLPRRPSSRVACLRATPVANLDDLACRAATDSPLCSYPVSIVWKVSLTYTCCLLTEAHVRD